MSDIMERLRDKTRIEDDEIFQDMADAAALIERLRAENATLRKRLEIDPEHEWDGIACRDVTIKHLNAEVATLREALKNERMVGVEPVAMVVWDGTKEGAVSWLVNKGEPLKPGQKLYASPAIQMSAEPVADCVIRPLRGDESSARYDVVWRNGKPIAGPLYTSPAIPELTQEMVDAGAAMFEATLHSAADFKHHAVHVFNAMIAAAQVSAEPVAWMWQTNHGGMCFREQKPASQKDAIPLCVCTRSL